MRISVRQWILVVFLLVGADGAEAQTIYDLKTDVDSATARIDLLLAQPVRSVSVSTYDLHADPVGLSFLAALVKVARDGAVVRLIVDNEIKNGAPGLVEYLTKTGIQIRYYNPIKIGWRAVLSPLRTFRRLNRRMHDKMFIVNQTHAIIGDKNYGNQYYRYSLNTLKRHLTMLGKEMMIDGPAVGDVNLNFERLWTDPKVVGATEKAELTPRREHEFDQDFQTRLQELVLTMDKRPRSWRNRPFTYSEHKVLCDSNACRTDGRVGTETTMEKTLKLLEQTPEGSRVLIESPYFVLYPRLEEVLRTLVKRGVDVHVVVNSPEVADKQIIANTLKVDLPKIQAMGVHVHLNTAARRVSHAKLILIGDDIVINGSGNFDPRSYETNSESNLMVVSAELNRHYWKRFESDHPFQRTAPGKFSCEFLFSSRVHKVEPVSRLSPKKVFVEGARRQL